MGCKKSFPRKKFTFTRKNKKPEKSFTRKRLPEQLGPAELEGRILKSKSHITVGKVEVSMNKTLGWYHKKWYFSRNRENITLTKNE